MLSMGLHVRYLKRKRGIVPSSRLYYLIWGGGWVVAILIIAVLFLITVAEYEFMSVIFFGTLIIVAIACNSLQFLFLRSTGPVAKRNSIIRKEHQKGGQSDRP